MVEKIKTLGLHYIYRKEEGASKDKKKKRKEKRKGMPTFRVVPIIVSDIVTMIMYM